MDAAPLYNCNSHNIIITHILYASLVSVFVCVCTPRCIIISYYNTIYFVRTRKRYNIPYNGQLVYIKVHIAEIGRRDREISESL